MKNILVTGGTGFIGSHTCVALFEAGYMPIILDNLSNCEPNVINALEKITGARFPFYQEDCRDPTIYEKIHQHHPFESVIHFAALKAVGESMEKPLLYLNNNINSTIVLMEAMQKLGVQHLIFSSSCTVYGNPESPMVTEKTIISKPESIYGYTKMVCEQMIEQVVELNQAISAVILRYFNPIGAHNSGLIGEKPVGIPNNLVPFITQTAIGNRESLSVYGNDYPTRDGTCIRDFIHVCDLADAHVASLKYIENKSAKKSFTFNVGTGKGTTVLELIQAFEESTGLKLNWNFTNRRPGDVIEIFANTDRSNQELQWKAKKNIHDAMRDAWRWQQAIKDKNT
jgi:UDP-glucose 4-epimerase